jgi:hypothetical protein
MAQLDIYKIRADEMEHDQNKRLADHKANPSRDWDFWDNPNEREIKRMIEDYRNRN